MSVHAEEHNMSDDERPRPVRFSIFGQIQQRRLPFTNMPFKIEHSDDNEDYVDETEEDQPLDFSSKKGELPTETTPMDLAKSVGRYDTWQPGSHSSESGVSDLCSNSPQSDREAHLPSVASPPLSVNPLVHQLQRQSTSPLNPMYNPLSALQPTSPVASLGMSKTMDPTITAATSQLLSNLAAVTNGGKGGKNTRPFKAYPKDPLNLPLGLYGLPLSGNGGNEGMSQQSNEAYSEFRRQMLAQVQAAKAKRTPKTSISNGSNHSSSRPNSVNDHHDNSPDHMIGETTIQGTVSVTDLRISTTEDEMHPKSPQSVDFNGTPSACSSLGNTNGTPTTTGSGKKRGRSGDEVKDEAYWERRRKNNEAAKRSRDARRAKEDEIAIRAAFLEQENLKLRFEVAALKAETTKLRCMVYSS